LKERLLALFGTDDPEQAVRLIINEVRQGGDAALIELTGKIDGVKLASLEVSKQAVAGAYQQVDGELVDALKLAAERIRCFHQAQRECLWHEVAEEGMAQLIRPLARVGVYAPGGTAPYPSSLLMTAVPASVAGVTEIIMVTPPKPGGAIPPVMLVAADIAGIDRMYAVGGAQAVAALAYGTETIPAVDKICGPGNIFVNLAKKMVCGVVGIDGLRGPSEVLIIAGEAASPELCAADLLAQAEHDPLAQSILVTTSARFADEVNRELSRQMETLSRRQIVEQSLASGIIAVVASLDEAIELANVYAPEHLLLMVAEADAYLDKVVNAGCIVAGSKATVVLGDYVEGPSHALPTGGTARFSSPLTVADFIKFINVVTVDDDGLRKLGPAAAIIARAEGLDAHARSVERRLQID